MNDIIIEKLSKRFGEKVVFQDLSLVIKQGECNVIMGTSGCGKTTLLRILMGLEPADSGEIHGMIKPFCAVFQEDRLCMDLSALDNIRMVLPDKPRDGGISSKDRGKIRRELEKVGLAGFEDKAVRKLSGGMRRRVALLRAILAEADFILLDEPFKGLDEETRLKVMDYFIKTTRGKTTLVVTHDPVEAEYVGTNRIRLQDSADILSKTHASPENQKNSS